MFTRTVRHRQGDTTDRTPPLTSPRLSRRRLLQAAGALVVGELAGGVGGLAWARGGRGGHGTPDRQVPTVAYVGHAAPIGGLSAYRIPPSDENAWVATQTITDLGAPTALCLDFLQKVLYVAHGATGQVAAFAVDASTGALTHLGEQATGGRGAGVLALDPTNFFLVTAHAASATVTALPVSADGTLNPPREVLALPHAGPAVDRLALAVGRHGDIIVSPPGYPTPVVCRLDPLFGTLRLAQPADAQAGEGVAPSALVVHPVEPYAFGLVRDEPGVAVYTIGPDRLMLRSVVAIDGDGAEGGGDLALAPDGRSLYVAAGSGGLGTFAIDLPSGRLIRRGWVPVPGKPRYSLRLERTGTELYLAAEDADELIGFRMDPATSQPTEGRMLVQTLRPTAFVCKDRHFREAGGPVGMRARVSPGRFR